MQLGNLKMNIFLFIWMLTILNSSCKRENDLENQIIVKVNSIDSKTKRHRTDSFDTIVIKMIKFGYLKKNFVQVGEYIMDSKGSVKIKLDTTKEYHISLYGRNIFGWVNLKVNDLKKGQEINIESSTPDFR